MAEPSRLIIQFDTNERGERLLPSPAESPPTGAAGAPPATPTPETAPPSLPSASPAEPPAEPTSPTAPPSLPPENPPAVAPPTTANPATPGVPPPPTTTAPSGAGVPPPPVAPPAITAELAEVPPPPPTAPPVVPPPPVTAAAGGAGGAAGGAAAGAGGAGGAAAGGAAAAGLAVPVVGELLLALEITAITFEALYATVKAVDEEMHALAEDVKKFSPEVTLAQSFGKLDRTLAQLDRSRQIGGDLGRYEGASNDIKNALYRIETSFMKVLAPLAAHVAEDLAALIDMAESIVKMLDEAGVIEFGKWLGQLALDVSTLSLIAKWWRGQQKDAGITKADHVLRDMINRFAGRWGGLPPRDAARAADPREAARGGLPPGPGRAPGSPPLGVPPPIIAPTDGGIAPPAGVMF